MILRSLYGSRPCAQCSYLYNSTMTTHHSGENMDGTRHIFVSLLFFSILAVIFCFLLAAARDRNIQVNANGAVLEGKVDAAGAELVEQHLVVREWKIEVEGNHDCSETKSFEHGPREESSSISESRSPRTDESETDEEIGEAPVALDDENDLVLCAICLAPFICHEKVCESNNVSCRHVFHKGCMVPWLKKHNHCPVCRHTYLLEQSTDV
jgi:Ring finger domain